MKTLPKGFDETTIMVHQHEWEKDDSTEKKIIDHFVPTSKRGVGTLLGFDRGRVVGNNHFRGIYNRTQ